MQQRKFKETVARQYEEQGSCCVYCGEPVPFEAITRDHFHPLSKGYTFVNNKVFACFMCNSEKQDSDIYEFNKKTLERIQGILRKIVANNWKMSEQQYKRFQYLTKRLKTTTHIIENGGVPKILFT